MSKVAIKYEDAQTCVPKDYDTLATIVAEKCPEFTWQEFALYNWGTKLVPEVNRALIELYGCIEIDEADCTKTKIHARYAPRGGDRKMRIPQVWKKEGLPLEKTHIAKLKHRKPFPAIRITALDKWFIPETESCDFTYALEGLKERSDKVDFDVYASKYCKATSAADGKFLSYTFADLDIPLRERKAKLKADERGGDTVNDWKGESEAADGVLKPRGRNKRHVSVANSPYSVHLRYYKQSADEKARIELKPFWVRWKYPDPKAIPAPKPLTELFPLPGSAPAPAPAAAPPAAEPPLPPPTVVKESLKVKWAVKDTARLLHGQIIICDKDFKIVTRHALGQADLTAGDHEWTWDDTRTPPVLAQMPYRVQIQAHTAIEEDNGLAIAVMQTEVRLFVHKDVGKSLFDPLSEDPKDPQCLKLSVAPYWQKPAPPAIGSTEWYQLRLAEGGFYPGPVDGETRDELTNAIKEFQRSIPLRSSPGDTDQEDDARTARQTKNEADIEKAKAELKKKKAEEKVVAEENEVEKLKKAKEEAEAAKLKADADLAADANNAALQSAQQTATQKLTEAANKLTSAESALTTARNELQTAENELQTKTTEATKAANDLTAAEGREQAAIAGMADKKWKRIEADGAKNGDTQNHLATLSKDYHPLLAEPNRTDIIGSDPVSGKLTDPAAKAILWVNDRHAYTTCDVAPPEATMTMGDYRGDMQVADSRVDKDKVSVLRPWIPLQAEFALLSKADHLDATNMPEITDAMRRAIGPIRLDWTFTELGEDMSALDVSGTNASRVRTKPYVAHHVEAGRESNKNIYYYNCREDKGGVRPSSIASYYKAPFALAANSLQPCKATEDSARETVFVLSHDDLGQDTEHVFEKHVGKACVYLHPSNIAGDSYRYRAQVAFEKYNGAWIFPNHEFLNARYQRNAQAHTCGLRIWRKTSMRARSLWGPAGTGNFPASDDGSRGHYRNAFVEFCSERGSIEQPARDTLVGNADLNRFKYIITHHSENSRPMDDFKDGAKVTLDATYLWPWLSRPHWGILASKSTVSLADYEDDFLDEIWTDTWRKFREPLMHLMLLRLEQKTGKLRGHFVVEFQSSARFWKQRYECNSCNSKMVMVEKDSAGDSGGSCGEDCGGTLQPLWQHEYTCSRCNHVITNSETHDGSTHDKDGDACPRTRSTGRRCRGTLQGTGANKEIEQSPHTSLPFPAVGVALGATWIFNDHSGNAATWAHEIAHHRQLSHAADVDDAATKASEHDRAVNSVDPGLAGEGLNGLWDRDCIMSYSDDPQFFCGKCILKNRGWKVDALANP